MLIDKDEKYDREAKFLRMTFGSEILIFMNVLESALLDIF